MEFIIDPPIPVKMQKMKERVRWRHPSIVRRLIDQTCMVLDDGNSDNPEFSFMVIGDSGTKPHSEHHPQRQIALNDAYSSRSVSSWLRFKKASSLLICTNWCSRWSPTQVYHQTVCCWADSTRVVQSPPETVCDRRKVGAGSPRPQYGSDQMISSFTTHVETFRRNVSTRMDFSRITLTERYCIHAHELFRIAI